MKRMLLLSALGYLGGSMGLLAASNPMIAALYPEEKTDRLNKLHAWWPAGIVVGGLMGVAITGAGMPWQINVFILALSALVMAWLVWGSTFPVTERVAEGVSYGEMLGELVRRPLFWVFWVCMYLTALMFVMRPW